MSDRTEAEEPVTTDMPAELVAGTAPAVEAPAGQAPVSPAGHDRPLTTAEILWWERFALREPLCPTREEQLALSEERYNESAPAAGMTALCLSGGGIRSAAFSLGVVQALASRKLLTGFDYLSTVSGGGYLGSFLQRWILGKADDGRSEDRPDPEDRRDEAKVEAELAASLTGKSPHIEALREGANFITPKVGLMSSDTWTAIATSLRNVSVNWTLFVPMILLVAAIPALFYWLLMSMEIWGAPGAIAALVLHWAAATWAMTGVFLGLPSNREEYWTPKQIRRHILFPAVIAMVTMLVIVAGPSPQLGWREFWLNLVPGWEADPNSHKSSVLFGSMGFLWVPATAFAVALFIAPRVVWERITHDLLLWLVCGLAGGALLYLAAATAIDLGLIAWPVPEAASDQGKLLAIKLAVKVGLSGGMTGAELIVAFGPAVYVGCLLVAGWLFSVLRTEWRGTAARGKNATLRPDLDREWLVRISADLIRPVLGWTIIALICLVLTYFDAARQMVAIGGKSVPVGSWEGQLGLLGGAIASGLTAAFAGKSAGTLLGKVAKLVPLSAIALIATAIFAVIALLVAAHAISDLALLAYDHWDWKDLPSKQRIGWMLAAHAVLAAGLLLFLAVWGRFVDVNRFSLHGFYRYRLARAFLGAGRAGKGLTGCSPDIRMPDPYTGIDPKDNVRLHSLWPREERRAEACLFPVINVALNAVATKKLAWQERKALPFVMTPLACGSGWLGNGNSCDANGAYIDSERFGGTEPDEALKGAGVTLAAAMAISGAAASPNMGYHSSPATAFLMTLFNVRLGAWMPNPSLWKPTESNNIAERRRNGVSLLLRELGGRTSENDADVYLSDGGHFENLGLYEMLRRRCTSILVVDAGCDPDCSFEDLSNAARKAAIDLHVKLDFSSIKLASRKNRVESTLAYAVAEISYPGPHASTGWLIYLKPSLIEPLPIDVRAYAAGSELFPHESTADQWYTESQFESYRSLGAMLAGKLIEGKGGDDADDARVRLQAFFKAMEAAYGDAATPPSAPPRSPRSSRRRPPRQ